MSISPGQPETKKPTLAPPKAIFFDWDGTLVDSLAFLTQAHNHVRDKLGMPAFTEQDFLHYFGMPRDKLYADIYGDNAMAAKGIFEAYYHAHHLDAIVVAEGAHEFLQFAHEKGIVLGVVSNKKGDFLREEVRHLGWDRYFDDRIVGAGDALHDKPEPDPLLMGIDGLGYSLPIQEIWYIGDTEVDLLCSTRVGCISIVIKNLKKMNNLQAASLEAAITRHNPALIVKNCAEIQQFLLHCY